MPRAGQPNTSGGKSNLHQRPEIGLRSSVHRLFVGVFGRGGGGCHSAMACLAALPNIRRAHPCNQGRVSPRAPPFGSAHRSLWRTPGRTEGPPPCGHGPGVCGGTRASWGCRCCSSPRCRCQGRSRCCWRSGRRYPWSPLQRRCWRSWTCGKAEGVQGRGNQAFKW